MGETKLNEHDRDMLTEATLDAVEDLLANDQNLVSVEGETDERGEQRLYIYALNPPDVKIDEFATKTHGVELVVEQEDPLDTMSEEPAEQLNTSKVLSTQVGQGGLRILGGSGLGTLTMSLAGMTVEIYKGNQLIQRCHRMGATLIGNAHVFQQNGSALRHLGGETIGRCSCHFDLNRTPTVDYAHGDWTANVQKKNYQRVYDPSNPAGKRIVRTDPARAGMAIAMQGGTSGWTTGKVVRRARRKVKGFNGLHRCWRQSYKTRGGDSGAPVIARSGNEWSWVGVNFSVNHFWSWGDFYFSSPNSVSVRSIPLIDAL